MLRSIEQRGVYVTARKVFQWTGSVFRFAIATDRAETNQTLACKGALKTWPVQHMARIPEKELPELFAKINAYEGDVLTQFAFKVYGSHFRTNR